MSEFPRTQKIAALLLVTAVVVITLIVVASRGGGNESGATTDAVADPNAEPTPVPVLQRPRQQWSTIAASTRGAHGTSSPVDCPYVDERVRESNNFLSLTPALTFVCNTGGLAATPIAAGRVVMRVEQAPLNSFKAELLADGADGPWVRAAAYGSFVVVDHGSIDGASNVTSVYAGLERLSPTIAVGQEVDPSTPLGTLGARQINDEVVPGVLAFEMLIDDVRFGTDPVRQKPAPATDAARLATLVADEIALPVSTCNVPFGNPNLVVGAPRDYRSGTHNGLDFNCGTTDHSIRAAGDGQVLFVIDNYVDPTTEDRDAVLRMAESAFDTPFWTLAMLYGNFVVVDHRLMSGERAITIYAHLSEVDPGILPGVIVDNSTELGTVGNSGTSAAAAGIINNDGSIHLHWELHINDRPIGYLDTPQATRPLYEQILCTPDAPTTTVGC